MQFTRRQFLSAVGSVGGSAAVYQSALAIGLMPLSLGHRADITPIPAGSRKVVILGAGLAGLTCTYELEKAGYECIVLEASHRIGGRILTLRGGDTVDEMGHSQTCEFDEHPDLYFNAGPSRIPIHHHLLMHYLRIFQIPLEVFSNDNRNAWVHDTNAFGGKPLRIKEYLADARGFMAELASKSIRREDLEAPFSELDFENLRGFLRNYGDLDTNALYKGSPRSGYQSGGMLSPGIKKQPYDFREILKSSFWRDQMHFAESEDQAAPMLTATGGMDAIVKAFDRNIKSPILTNAQVQNVQLRENSVDVSYRYKGKVAQLHADYCLNNIPMRIMAGISNNFPDDYQQALNTIPSNTFFKIGMQMKERFWEREDIYGGISWTDQDLQQLWYPSHGTFGERGIMIGYTFSSEATNRFARLNPEQRLEKILNEASVFHPGIRGYVESAVSVPWHRMNHMMGCSAKWNDELRARWFRRLQQPVGRHYMIGDQISYHPTWQEGALSSAHHTLSDLTFRNSVEESA